MTISGDGASVVVLLRFCLLVESTALQSLTARVVIGAGVVCGFFVVVVVVVDDVCVFCCSVMLEVPCDVELLMLIVVSG